MSYGYNANGSRSASIFIDGTREDYTYDKAGNVLSVIHRDSNGNFLDAYIYRYDEDNNLIFENKTAGTTVYTYDSFNRLISVKQGDTTSSYTYDAADYRTSSTVNGTKEYSCYENGKLKAEADRTGTVTAVNHYGLVLFARDTLTETYYYLYNAHRDVVMLVYTQGGIAATYQYDAFGNILKATGTADNTTTYAGYRYDESTGLYYVNARYYDSTIARFLTEDSYTGEKNDPLSLNRYTYCVNNPLKYYDPSGHKLADVINKGKEVDGQVVSFAERTFSGNGVKTSDTLTVVGLGFVGLDLPWDINSLVNDSLEMANYICDWTPQSYIKGSFGNLSAYGNNSMISSQTKGQKLFNNLVIDAIAFVPFIGNLKYSDELFSIAKNSDMFKYSDEMFDTVKTGNKVNSKTTDLIEMKYGSTIKGGSEVITAPQKVIGHYPEYVELSTKLNTKPFSVPDNIWNKMTSAEQWAANQKFLDRAISKGTEFNLATPIDKVRPGSYLQKEIEHLISQGYKLNCDATKLIK